MVQSFDMHEQSEPRLGFRRYIKHVNKLLSQPLSQKSVSNQKYSNKKTERAHNLIKIVVIF